VSGRPKLRALARRLGVHDGYVAHGGRRVATTDAIRAALVAAMGGDGSTEAAAARTLARLAGAEAAVLLPPVRVARLTGRQRPVVEIAAPPGVAAGGGAWVLELIEEDGRRTEVCARLATPAAGRNGTSWRVRLPRLPAPGYHRVRLTLETRAGVHGSEQALILVPGRCPTPADRLGGRRVFGLCANLYTVRSRANWGAGDLGDLGRLVDWGAAHGAAFVGVNPLHALRNTGGEVSPYRPISRLFRNVLYLDMARVPELADSAAARARLRSRAHTAALAAWRAGDRVDYGGVATAKLAVGRLLHRAFVIRHRACGTARGRAYAAFRARHGDVLRDFATFLALDAVHTAAGKAPGAWRSWPAGHRDPRAPAVAAFRVAHADEVDFHCYLQFVLEEQLGAAAARARTAGMPIGVYQDLAIGSSPDGSDPWAFPALFLDGASVGAPPDDYAPTGQDWSLPALDPHALTAGGYRYWTHLLRNALTHAGALRVDHVMGLLRQYWIPAGRPGTEGAYVRFPADDLLGILALEATRAGALVVGEDIGTVPAGFSHLMARWGILSSRVLYFERTSRGAFRAASRYTPRALATANTHDHVPLAGWWAGRDLALRRDFGFIDGAAAYDDARAARARERTALRRRLVADGALPARVGAPSDAVLRGAVHRFLCGTPAALVGVALDDLAGETEPVNVPGVGGDRYSSWTRRMRVSLEGLATTPAVATALAGTRGRAWRRRRRG
jgi:4-alpha-glucanotransferase